MTVTVDEYRRQQERISSRSEQTILAVAATSALSGFTLATTLGRFLYSMNLAATQLADAAMNAFLGFPPLGLSLPGDEEDRLIAVFAGLLEDSHKPDPLPRIARAAKSEPSNAGRIAARTAMRQRNVQEYRWILDPKPCPLCLDLASRPYRVDQLPISHPNCECTVVPVISVRGKSLKRPERNAA